MTTEAEQLTDETVPQYLHRRGFHPGPELQVCELAGGVSGRCILVESPRGRWVVKQSRADLAVDAAWHAKPERAMTEAAALEVLYRLTPSSTPRVVDRDPALCAFTMTAAPRSYRPWKTGILEHRFTDAEIVSTAGELGALLGNWHARTATDSHLATDFTDYETFHQLRITPFHQAICAAHPHVAPAIDACIAELLSRRECLIHGDFSPKNVLVGDGPAWVIDCEVAHFGAPIFDVAFMDSHLILKAVNEPARAPMLHRAATTFWDSYRAVVPTTPSTELLAQHVACLVLARVDGISPVDYLDPRGRATARRPGLSILSDSTRSQTLEDLWDRIT